MAAPKGNLFALGNNGGRPRMFETVDELIEKAEAYFEFETDKTGKSKATVTGLAYHLGFNDRQSLYDYEKRSDEFSCIIKRLRLYIEYCYEKQLYGFTPSGAIFALKNMGWRDKTESEVNSTVKMEKIQVEIIPAGVPIATSEKDVDQ